jgi:hypothetical protein
VRRIVLASEVADMHADPTACHTAGFVWRGSEETTRAGCYHQRVERPTGEACTPDDQQCAACVARQGVWRRDGILQRLQCTTIFPDANRLCTSASDCEGRSCFDRHRRWPDHGIERYGTERYGSCVPRAPSSGAIVSSAREEAVCASIDACAVRRSIRAEALIEAPEQERLPGLGPQSFSTTGRKPSLPRAENRLRSAETTPPVMA